MQSGFLWFSKALPELAVSVTAEEAKRGSLGRSDKPLSEAAEHNEAGHRDDVESVTGERQGEKGADRGE
ncbi:hypothetical protein [Thermodesulfitimonas autotrophica]|uniref:hypothetical protein n=1 Tax=Thermodesulfitimonas autotrophica TaxID=1894989 RepID=UPI000F4EE320|nr:hypothetical protein [Thermodesulfitimonas autotrophica]